jgi:hypothetical protein
MFLFLPLAALPLQLSVAIWVLSKVLVLVWLLRALARRLGLLDRPVAMAEWLIPLLVAGAYVVEDFRYENAQFFIFVLVATSLLKARERPVFSASALALAIAIKVWPLFFLPYFAVRRDWRVVSWTLVFVLVLTLLPSLWFGVGGNANLLGQWFSQEFSTQLGQSEIWFPNQSLRGVLMRYFTVVDYSQLPDSNYPQIHMVAADPTLIRNIWALLAGAVYLGLLVTAYRHRHRSDDMLVHGLAFCLLALLQPFTQKYALVVLLWPALMAGQLVRHRTARILIYMSVALILVQPLAPGAAIQRMLQVLGFDFAAATLLAMAMAYGVYREVPPHKIIARSSSESTPCVAEPR